MDMKRVNAAVKIKLSYMRHHGTGKPSDKKKKLMADLLRLMNGMTSEEYNEYMKRIR